MKMKANLELAAGHIVELRKMAEETNIEVGELVGGIVTLYLNGKVRGHIKEPLPEQERFINAVLSAATKYQAGEKGESRALSFPKSEPRDNFFMATPADDEALHRPKGGRPPMLTNAEVRQAKKMKADGFSYAEIAGSIGVGRHVVRDALTRNLPR
jgi:hypothetical protein